MAALQASGYFVEPQLALRDGGKEVLELDVVATPVGGALDDRVLFEVTKDRFSFPDIFKLYGQRIYLDISHATLVSMRGTDDAYLPVYEARGQELGVEVCRLPAEVGEIDRLGEPPNGVAADARKVAAATGWYGQIARRLAIGELQNRCKDNRGVREFEAARVYRFNTRASFFHRSALSRAEALYSAYLESPRLSQDMVRYEASRQQVSEKTIWKRARDTHQELAIQGLMDLESAARFAIVKNALDDFFQRGVLPPPTTTLRVGSLALPIPMHALPQSFHRGLEVIRDHQHGPKLPYLFQVFYSLFGGFLFIDDEDDLQLVEMFTGVPANDVAESLKIFDAFFSSGGSSFFFTVKDSLVCMKMVPGFVRGTGAFFRHDMEDITSYQDRYPEMGWLIARWHNALYHALYPELGADQAAGV